MGRKRSLKVKEGVKGSETDIKGQRGSPRITIVLLGGCSSLRAA